MADLEDVIRTSIADISEESSGGSDDEGGSADDGGADSEVSTTDETGEGESGAGTETTTDTTTESSETEGKSAKASEETTADDLLNDEDKSLLADLKTFGIKVKNINANNRMPYKRHLRTLVNAVRGHQERLTGEHTKALSEREERLSKAEARIKEIDEIDRIAEADPDKYIGILATLHPEKYGKFINRQQTVEKPIASRSDPMPQPDLKYEDGSLGYSPERFQQVLTWNRQEAKREAEESLRKEYDARLAPIEQRSKNETEVAKAQAARAQRVTQAVTEVYDQWGKERVESHQKEIFEYLDKNPKASLGKAVSAILLPKLESDRAKIRADLLKEQNERPAAAKKTTAAAGKVTDEGGSGDRVLDAIQRSIAGLKR